MISYFKYFVTFATLSIMAMDHTRYSDQALANGFKLLAMYPFAEYKEIFETKTPHGLLVTLHPHAVRGVLDQDCRSFETKLKLSFLIERMKVKLDCASGKKFPAIGEMGALPLFFDIVNDSIMNAQFEKAEQQAQLFLAFKAKWTYAVNNKSYNTLRLLGHSELILSRLPHEMYNQIPAKKYIDAYYKIGKMCFDSAPIDVQAAALRLADEFRSIFFK